MKWYGKIIVLYFNIVNGIAFIPLALVCTFLAISFGLIAFKDTSFNKQIIAQIDFLESIDTETARSALSLIVNGLTTLTVFTFSMVMLVVSFASNNYSPKILNAIVRDRRPKIILGMYIGSIAYCIPLLIQIRDLEGEYSVPAIGVFMGLVILVLNLFLFIFFIDHVTNAIRPNHIVKRILKNTRDEFAQYLEKFRLKDNETNIDMDGHSWHTYPSLQSGYLQDVVTKRLLKILQHNDCMLKFIPYFGDHIVKDVNLYKLSIKANEQLQKQIDEALIFHNGEQIDENLYYGFRQLSEVAVKALSPGINDPGTAKICINSLTELFALFIQNKLKNVIADESGKPRIIIHDTSLETLMRICLDPIRHYGKKDKSIIIEMLKSLSQLHHLANNGSDLAAIEMQINLLQEDAEQYIDNEEDKRIVRTISSQLNLPTSKA